MLPEGRDITPKWAWLWSFKMLPFAMMQRVARFISDSWATCLSYCYCIFLYCLLPVYNILLF